MTVKLTPEDAGCWIDGHWGQYATAHMVLRASELGYADAEVIELANRKLGSMYPAPGPDLADEEEESLYDASDEVEQWLNENVTPEGYSFGWHDGEFFLWSDEEWEQDS